MDKTSTAAPMITAVAWPSRVLRPPGKWLTFFFCALAGLPPLAFWLALDGGRHPDSMLYYGAAPLAMSGDIATIFDPERMTESLNNLFYPGSTPLGFDSRHFGVCTCAVRLGAPEALAMAAQLCAGTLAVAATYRAFRSDAQWKLRLAALLCGTALATPHIAPYDLALVACALVLIVTCSLASGFLAREAIVMALA